MSAKQDTRKARIAKALDALQSAGYVDDYYIQGGMPGLKWIVWGRGVGAYEYNTGMVDAMTAERSYTTAEVERFISATQGR